MDYISVSYLLIRRCETLNFLEDSANIKSILQERFHGDLGPIA